MRNRPHPAAASAANRPDLRPFRPRRPYSIKGTERNAPSSPPVKRIRAQAFRRPRHLYNAADSDARHIKARDLSTPLDILSPGANGSGDARTGLKIILRGTRQLADFPRAKEALARAAAQWETFVETEITVVIDVDFGPSLFGGQFPDDTVSVTDVQLLTGNALYPALRSSLISEASSPQEKSLLSRCDKPPFPPTWERSRAGRPRRLLCAPWA